MDFEDTAYIYEKLQFVYSTLYTTMYTTLQHTTTLHYSTIHLPIPLDRVDKLLRTKEK